MENKNLIIAFVLILAVWFGSNLIFPPVQQPTEDSGQQTVENKVEKDIPQQTPQTEIGSAISGTDLPPAEQRELVVENDYYTAVFTTSGGRLKSFILKNYQQSTEPSSPPVELVKVEGDQLATLRTMGSGDFDISPEMVFSLNTQEKRRVLGQDEEIQIVFSGRTARGVRIDKIFSMRGNGYDFNLEIRLTNTAGQPLRGGVDLSLVEPWDESMAGSRYSFVGPVLYQGEKLHTYKVEKIEEEAVEEKSEVVWTAFEKNYFMAAVVPQEEAAGSFRIQKSGEAVENSVASETKVLNPGEQVSFDYFLYFGPRDLDILKDIDNQLEQAIDFGFFGVIARPLLHVLKFFYQYVGNYGIAIILLTVIIKLLFWPLTQKSYQSMKAMQTVQPEMQKIREKFKNDKERMNKEIMELYKAKRVNPMGGCLPMFVQIPVFFALYKVLLGTIELRHAPFVFWLQDLSAKDPYYITPIVMGATMFLQQKMSPSTMDPNQAKIFMFMPIVFTFMFLNFPSGLVIYWLVNNLLTILQQWFINRKGSTAAA